MTDEYVPYGEEPWRKFLTLHGQSVEVCKHVIEKYKDNEMYKDNQTVQLWVKHSEDCLNFNTPFFIGEWKTEKKDFVYPGSDCQE